VKGFVERAEEMEEGATLPGFQINLNGTGTVLLGHHFHRIRPETNVAEVLFQCALPVYRNHMQASWSLMRIVDTAPRIHDSVTQEMR
jgi:hypothetical protein